MIRIAFRYGDKTRWFSRAICAWRGGDTAHCEVAWRWDGPVHHCVSASIEDGGVRGKVIPMAADKWRIYEVPGNPEDVLAWLAEHEGDGYGFLRLLRFFIGLRINVGGPICSGVGAKQMRLPNDRLFDPRALDSVCRMLVAHGAATLIQETHVV